ncbi:MAG: alpha/beta hydrolase, partial [Flavobacteriaceae bacterium]
STSKNTFTPDELIAYKSIDSVELKLHIFRPKVNTYADKAPAIVFFFGGGWAGGTPKQFYQQSDFFAKKGMVAISAEYRVRSRNKTSPFESVKDARSAIRWVRKHAKDLGVDPDKIVASGGSAGGHIAACAGMDLGDDDDLDLSVSCISNAMILFNPVLDTTEERFALRFGENRKTEVSPVHHVKNGLAPSIVFHGEEDQTVPFENAEHFLRLMKEAGNDCTLESYKGKGHGFFNGSFFRPKLKDTTPYFDTIQKSVSFLVENNFLVGEK